jgi:hypothetical protein
LPRKIETIVNFEAELCHTLSRWGLQTQPSVWTVFIGADRQL